MCTITCRWTVFLFGARGDTIAYKMECGLCDWRGDPTPDCKKRCEDERAATQAHANNNASGWPIKRYRFPPDRTYERGHNVLDAPADAGSIVCKSTVKCEA